MPHFEQGDDRVRCSLHLTGTIYRWAGRETKGYDGDYGRSDCAVLTRLPLRLDIEGAPIECLSTKWRMGRGERADRVKRVQGTNAMR
jgi:hypothetical protein